MSHQELPLCFDCNGESLIGIAHVPDAPEHRGILMIIAGGPQHRAGVGRQLVTIARIFAENNIPVMRFDYRGTGDSSGEHLGFEDMTDDLNAAIEAFMQTVPEISEIILWGGCNAASVALMDGPDNDHVTGMIILNPWVHSENIKARAARHYYLKRLTQESFWKKLLQFKINPLKTAQSVYSETRTNEQKQADTKRSNTSRRPFQEHMLEGAQRFNGKILIIISGHSVVSREFDALVSSSDAWRKALKRPGVTRLEISDANQTFSTIAARQNLIEQSMKWLDSWRSDNSHSRNEDR